MFHTLRATYGLPKWPTEHTICCTIKKYKTQFLLLDSVQPNRPHPAHSENIAVAAESLCDICKESIQQHSQQLGLSYPTTWCT